MGLRESILGAQDRKTVTVDVPDWGCSVIVRAFSGQERDAWEQNLTLANKTGKPIDNFRAKLAALVIVDEQGNRVFSDNDVAELGKKSAAALDRVFDAFLKLNAMSKSDVDELEKNS